MLKWQERHDPRSCWSKAGDEEPLFVLRAHDPLAPLVVAYWAQLASGGNTQPPEVIAEAVDFSCTMREWREAEQMAKAKK